MPIEQLLPHRSRLLRIFESKWLLAGVVLLAAVLRFASISESSLWLDEILTLELRSGWGADALMPTNVVIDPSPDRVSLASARSWKNVMQSVAASGHPPLYFLTLRLWTFLLGDHDAVVRGLSAVSSIAALLLLARCVELLQGRAVALFSALLMAIAPTQIEFAQEARNYAFVLPFVLGAALALLEIGRSGVTRLCVAVLALCCLAAVLSHYFAIACTGALAIYAAHALRGQRRRAAFSAFALAAALFLVLWGPFLIGQLPTFVAQNAWLKEAGGADHLLLTAQRALAVPARLITRAAEPTIVWAVLGAGLCILSVMSLRVGKAAAIWGIWFLSCVGMIAALDLVRTTRLLEFPRYTFFASPAIVVLPLVALRRTFRGITLAGVALLCLLTLPSGYVGKFDRRHVSRTIDSLVPTSEPLLFAGMDGMPWFAPAEFVAVSRYSRTTRRIVVLDGAAPPELRRALEPYSRLWMFRPVVSPPPESILPGYRVLRAQPFGNDYELLTLLRLQG